MRPTCDARTWRAGADRPCARIDVTTWLDSEGGTHHGCSLHRRGLQRRFRPASPTCTAMAGVRERESWGLEAIWCTRPAVRLVVDARGRRHPVCSAPGHRMDIERRYGANLAVTEAVSITTDAEGWVQSIEEAV